VIIVENFEDIRHLQDRESVSFDEDKGTRKGELTKLRL